jgi:hypothetical protein
MKKKLPKELYVVWDEPGDGESYLLAAEKPEDHVTMSESKVIGCYRLAYQDAAQGVPHFTRIKGKR